MIALFNLFFSSFFLFGSFSIGKSENLSSPRRRDFEIQEVIKTLRFNTFTKLTSDATQFYTFNYFIDNTCSTLTAIDSIGIGPCYQAYNLKTYLKAILSTDGTYVTIQFSYDSNCNNNTANVYKWPVKSTCTIGSNTISTSPVPYNYYFTSSVGPVPGSFSTGILQA
jgi:hypothetical protein